MEHGWPLNHLGSIWYHSEPADVPYSKNLLRPISWFGLFLQKNDSSMYLTCTRCLKREELFLNWMWTYRISRKYLYICTAFSGIHSVSPTRTDSPTDICWHFWNFEETDGSGTKLLDSHNLFQSVSKYVLTYLIIKKFVKSKRVEKQFEFFKTYKMKQTLLLSKSITNSSINIHINKY